MKKKRNKLKKNYYYYSKCVFDFYRLNEMKYSIFNKLDKRRKTLHFCLISSRLDILFIHLRN